MKSNGLVESIRLNSVSPLDDAVAWVTLRPVIEYSAALALPPTSAIGTVSVMVGVPALGNVKAFGGIGYVQEFTDAANTSLKDALVTGAASLGGTNAVFGLDHDGVGYGKVNPRVPKSAVAKLTAIEKQIISHKLGSIPTVVR